MYLHQVVVHIYLPSFYFVIFRKACAKDTMEESLLWSSDCKHRGAVLVSQTEHRFVYVESNWNAQVPTSQNYFYSASNNNWNMGFWNSNVPILTSLFSTGSCGSESLLKRIISMGLYSTAWNHCNIRRGIPAVVGCGFTTDWMRHDLKGHTA